MKPPVQPTHRPNRLGKADEPERASRVADGANYVLDQIHLILAHTDTTAVRKALDALEHAQRVFLYGAGRSGLVARAFAVRLMHLGFQTYVIGETVTAPVAKGDVVFLISGSGETYPVVMTAEIAHNVGATVVSITSNAVTGIAKFSDIVVHLETGSEADRQKGTYAPLGTLFESATWILLDGFVADLMVRLGQTEVAMRKRHSTLE